MKDKNGKQVFAGAIIRVSDRPVKKQNGTFLVERVYFDDGYEVAFIIKMSPKLGRINTNAPVMYGLPYIDGSTIEVLDDALVTDSLVKHMEEMKDNTYSMIRQYRSKYLVQPDDEELQTDLRNVEDRLQQYTEAVIYLTKRLENQ